MKVLVLTTSRADWNGLGMVARECVRRKIAVCVCAYTIMPDWGNAINDDGLIYDCGLDAIERQCIEFQPDVAVVAGDRWELLEACITLCKYKIPICHIGGGDITEGSMDNRYRDAITMLACIHCVETERARERLKRLGLTGDSLYLTGQPGLDRIKQTPLLKQFEVLQQTGLGNAKPTALVCVHPNTVASDPLVDYYPTQHALADLGIQCVCIGANADPGGAMINALLEEWAKDNPFVRFLPNVSPQFYYSLMAYCHVMVGNSSAGTAEAPCFGIPVVNVGDRQKGREFGPSTWHAVPTVESVRQQIDAALWWRSAAHKSEPWQSPYGDGESAPRIVKALEDNAWRWSSKQSEVSHVKQEIWLSWRERAG